MLVCVLKCGFKGFFVRNFAMFDGNRLNERSLMPAFASRERLKLTKVVRSLSKRQSDILHVVREFGSRSIGELADDLQVTTETIRRNIKPLIDEGLVSKFHGGVMLSQRTEEPPFQRRMHENQEAKQKAARLVAKMIRNGDSIMLDTGATTAYVAQALESHSNLFVVTNSAQISWLLAPRTANRVFMVGGELRSDDAAAFGSAALSFISQFKVKYAILSIGGVSASGQLMDFHYCEAEFSRGVMAQADEVWVVSDHTKLCREAPIKVCDLVDIDCIITDEKPASEFLAMCEQMQVRVIWDEDQIEV